MNSGPAGGQQTAAGPERGASGVGGAGSTGLSRKCSNCGRAGHNSRTCLEQRDAAGSGAGSTAEGDVIRQVAEQHRAEQQQQQQAQQQAAQAAKREEDAGAASDDSASAHPREGRKKGVAWTEEEHRLFLLGLQKLGKGDWRGISRHYVQTRSPTQVASHAQKYFIRQSVAGKRKRRSSLFDLVPDNAGDLEATSPRLQQARARANAAAPPAAAQPRTPELPQLVPAGFPGLPHGGAADPLALAYYWQALLAQQHPMAWMHALLSQGQAQQQLSMAQQLPQMPGLVPPQLLAQAGFPGSQAFAGALLAQQQQLAAAMALGAGMPFNPPELPGLREPPATAAGPLRSASAPLTGLSEPPGRRVEQEQLRLARSPSLLQRPPAQEDSQRGSGQPRLIPQSSAEQSTGAESARRQLSSEAFGQGQLVRPKATKVAQTPGELPSFMREAGTSLSGSLESHDTALLRPTKRPRGHSLPTELSGSTHGGGALSCFSGCSAGMLPASADEQSVMLGSRPPPRPPPKPKPPPAQPRERFSSWEEPGKRSDSHSPPS